MSSLWPGVHFISQGEMGPHPRFFTLAPQRCAVSVFGMPPYGFVSCVCRSARYIYMCISVCLSLCLSLSLCFFLYIYMCIYIYIYIYLFTTVSYRICLVPFGRHVLHFLGPRRVSKFVGREEVKKGTQTVHQVAKCDWW